MYMMKAISNPRVDLEQFLEVVLMWHCAGDIPMTRSDTCRFIEDTSFENFLQSVHYMSNEFGLQEPSRSQIVQTLHLLYQEEA